MSINIGDNFKYEFIFTQSDVNIFAEISGDKNPIHIDNNFASKTIFGKPIIHGFLSGSIISKILGTDFPGPGTIYLSQEMKFLKPMFVQEKYICKVEITQINSVKNILTLSTSILNEEGKVTLDGQAVVLNKEIFN